VTQEVREVDASEATVLDEPPTEDARLRALREHRFTQRLISWRGKLTLAGVIIILSIVTAARSSVFLTWENWSNILQQNSVLGILACGTTLLMISGGIDLSIGANVSFTGLIIAELMVHGSNIAVAVLIGVAAATGVGLFNGVLAAHSNAHPFILTLGTWTVLQGGALMISTLPVSGLPESFLDFTFKRPLGIPMVVYFFVGIAAFSQLLLSITVFGRHIYALGGSEMATRLAGVRVRVVKIALYGLSGLMVGVAATLLVSMLSAGQSNAGQGLELNAVAAVAVGGTPLGGGRGDIVGTLLGVLLIGVIGNSLNLLSIDPNLQYVLVGAIIVVAVMSQRQAR
jgi:ribose/xylose/arabinose/galactoside ABC-type transport system permease subunit